MKTIALLLVTWLAPGYGASSYQVEFPTRAECLAAQLALVTDAKTINNTAGNPRVVVSAVCVDWQK